MEPNTNFLKEKLPYGRTFNENSVLDYTTKEPKIKKPIVEMSKETILILNENKENMTKELDTMLLCKTFKTDGIKTIKDIQIQENNSKGTDAKEEMV